MKEQTKARKWLMTASLGYMGGLMFTLMYIRYVFYTQMMETMNINNTQLGMLTTISGIASLFVAIPGGFIADHFDAKKTIIFSISAMTIITFLYAAFINSYTFALVLWAIMPVAILAYYPSLVKYLNNMGGADEAGQSFGNYYLFNGLAGALGNAVPLFVYSQTNNFRLAIIALGVMTALATVLVIFFLDDEKQLAERGISLRGDEPVRLKYVLTVLKWPGFWLLPATVFFCYSLYSNLSYFNPYLIDVLGIEPTASSAVSIIRSYGAMVVAPLGGILADKVFKSTSKWFMGSMVVTIIVIACVFLFGPDSNKVLVTIYSLIPSLVVYTMYSVYWSIMRELHMHPAVAGTAAGVAGLFGDLGNVVWPTYFGSILDNQGAAGYTTIFIWLIIIAACIFVIGFLGNQWDKACKSGKRTFKMD